MLFHLLWRMGAFLCQHEASKIKNAIVRNSFSAVVYTAYNITHTIEKPIAALCQCVHGMGGFYCNCLR